MPYRKEQLASGEIYHIVIRALDDNLLFKDINDYFRMVFSIYEFNNSNRVEILKRRKIRINFKKRQNRIERTPDVPSNSNYRGDIGCIGCPLISAEDRRDRLVDVLCFEWMPNHIHLLIRQLQEGGISKFMQKVGIGYSKYFNTKYQRQGHLFQDTFRAIHIKTDEQLINAFVYIHTNAIALIEPGWKERGVEDPEKVKKFLEQEYRWGSCWDYLGKKNFPSVTEREFILEVLGGVEGVRRALNNWIDHKGEMNALLRKSFEKKELRLFE